MARVSRHPEPVVRVERAVAVHQPRDQRGGVGALPRDSHGVPQLHGHELLPAPPAVPARVLAPGRDPVQGLRTHPHRVRDRRVLPRLPDAPEEREDGHVPPLLRRVPARGRVRRPVRPRVSSHGGVRGAHGQAARGQREAVQGQLGRVQRVRQVEGNPADAIARRRARQGDVAVRVRVPGARVRRPAHGQGVQGVQRREKGTRARAQSVGRRRPVGGRRRGGGGARENAGRRRRRRRRAEKTPKNARLRSTKRKPNPRKPNRTARRRTPTRGRRRRSARRTFETPERSRTTLPRRRIESPNLGSTRCLFAAAVGVSGSARPATRAARKRRSATRGERATAARRSSPSTRGAARATRGWARPPPTRRTRIHGGGSAVVALTDFERRRPARFAPTGRCSYRRAAGASSEREGTRRERAGRRAHAGRPPPSPRRSESRPPPRRRRKGRRSPPTAAARARGARGGERRGARGRRRGGSNETRSRNARRESDGGETRGESARGGRRVRRRRAARAAVAMTRSRRVLCLLFTFVENTFESKKNVVLKKSTGTFHWVAACPSDAPALICAKFPRTVGDPVSPRASSRPRPPPVLGRPRPDPPPPYPAAASAPPLLLRRPSRSSRSARRSSFVLTTWYATKPTTLTA